MLDPHCSTDSQDKNVDPTPFFDVRVRSCSCGLLGPVGEDHRLGYGGCGAGGCLRRFGCMGLVSGTLVPDASIAVARQNKDTTLPSQGHYIQQSLQVPPGSLIAII